MTYDPNFSMICYGSFGTHGLTVGFDQSSATLGSEDAPAMVSLHWYLEVLAVKSIVKELFEYCGPP